MARLDPKTKSYIRIKNRLALLEPIILLIFMAVMQVSGLSNRIREISVGFLPSPHGTIFIYALLFGVVYYITTFYLNFYRGYIIEKRFGLSNQGLSSWAKDELKRCILSLLLFIIFVEFLYFLLRNTQEYWWLFMATGWIFLTIVMAKLAPVIIIPLFYKFELLGDNELRERLVHLADRFDIKVLDVFRLDLSAKTKKANAALVGMGKTRRVLLGDTLIENYTKDEIEVVMAHELAHHKLAHMSKLVFSGSLGMIATFYFINLLSKISIGPFGIRPINDISAFPSMIFFIILFGLIISPIQNAFSRRLEASADLMCLKKTGLKKAFISCMEKLAKQNLADPEPNRFIEIMLYDHPPISKRLAMAKDFKGGTL